MFATSQNRSFFKSPQHVYALWPFGNTCCSDHRNDGEGADATGRKGALSAPIAYFELYALRDVGRDTARCSGHPFLIRLLAALRLTPKMRHHSVIVFRSPSISM